MTSRPQHPAVTRLLAIAGLPPTGKIPHDLLDAAIAKLDLPLRKRPELKAQLYNVGAIKP
jgi:hypothetical protein